MVDRIVIDPVTRIEGHLRIEAQLEGGVVKAAYSSGTMFRGMELILQGRDPREAWIWAQRICGVCTTVHAHTSVNAVEAALEIEIPPNANLIRNLITGAQYIQDHVIHFYHLHALDWVDVAAALKADPAATSKLAQSISDWPLSSEDYFAGVKARVAKLVASGQLSLFTNGYWGHPAYQLPPEADLMAVAHYLEALTWQREVIKVHAVLGGKNPHLQTYLVGGMAAAVDGNSPNVINWERIDFLAARIKQMRDFVEQVYIPDVKAVASFYPEWWQLGAGHKNYMSYGGLQNGLRDDQSTFTFNRGHHPRRRPVHGPSRWTRPRSPRRSPTATTSTAPARSRPCTRSPARPSRSTRDPRPRSSSSVSTGRTPGSRRRATTARSWRSARSPACLSRTVPATPMSRRS